MRWNDGSPIGHFMRDNQFRREKGMKLGARDCQMKPCDIDQLMAEIEAAKVKRSIHMEMIRRVRIAEITVRGRG